MRSQDPPEDPAERESSSSEGDTTLETILDQYLTELASGKAPDQERYLRAHPELAESLRGIFRTLGLMETSRALLAPPQLEEGSHIGDFRIVREVARGGMGVVYEAIQTSLGRRVALKVLPAGALLSEKAQERFSREASTAAALHHTGIVPVFAVGEEEGISYYAMQYIDGCTLAQRIKELRREDAQPDREHFRRVAEWGRQVSGALAYAHGQGTIHRDIKPSNLLLDGQGKVWIADFGLARASDQATITASGDAIGTARYMSPEQAGSGSGELDHRTDIYSLGASLYELLCLRPAFEGDSREEVLNRIVLEEPVPLRRRDGSLPRDLETIVSRCMQKEARLRYTDTAAVAEDLRRFLAGESILARRPTILTRALRQARRHRALVGAACLIALLATVAAFLALSARRAEGERRLEEAFNQIFFERDQTRASELLDDASARGIDSARLHLYRALLSLVNRQTGDSLAHLDQALRREPDSIEARVARAVALSVGGDYRSGMQELESIPAERIDTALGWMLHGDMLSQTQGSPALDSYDRATDLCPDFVPAIASGVHYYGYRMLTEGRREDLDPMLADCRALTVFRPNSARSFAVSGHGWLAAAALAATRPDLLPRREEWLASCQRDLAQAVSFSRPDDPLALVQLGTFRRYVGDYAAAERAFARALEAESRSDGGEDHTISGKHAATLYALGRLEEALAESEETCLRVPTFYPASLMRALLLVELDRAEEARDVCRGVVRRQAAHSTNAVVIAATTMELVGFRDEAEEAIRGLFGGAARRVTSEDAEGAYSALALAYFAGEEGAAGLLEGVDHSPGLRCELSYLVGLRRLAAGEREEGLAALRACIDTQVFRFLEHRFAQVLLARAEADPAWPRWVGEER